MERAESRERGRKRGLLACLRHAPLGKREIIDKPVVFVRYTHSTTGYLL